MQRQRDHDADDDRHPRGAREEARVVDAHRLRARPAPKAMPPDAGRTTV
jgi:hypothetical protein